MDDELLTIPDLCKWLKISSVTAWRWRQEGMPHIKRGSSIRFEKEEVLKWLKENDKQ